MTTETTLTKLETTLNQRMVEVAKGHLGAKDWELSFSGEYLTIFRPVKGGVTKSICISKRDPVLEFNEVGKQPLTCTISLEQQKELLGYATPIDLSSF